MMHCRMRWFGMVAAILGLAVFTSGLTLAQQTAPATQPADPNRGIEEVMLNGKKISIDYGRPEMKGRDLLSMAPDGFVWRFGMNTSTTFKTDADLLFGDKKLPKGAYSAWIKHVTGDQWTLIFNSEVGIWGLPGAKRENDVLEVPLKYSKADNAFERLTVTLMDRGGEGHLLVAWGTHRLETTFRGD